MATAPNPSRLPLLTFLTLVLVSAQFLLGMGANLFFHFPETGSRWAAASTGLVGLHVILGTLLVVAAVVVLVVALRHKSARWTVASALGLVGILVAWGAGTSFVTADSDMASFWMSCGFAVSVLSYAGGLWAAAK